MSLYPEGTIASPYEEFYSKVQWLKANGGKTYRVYRYSARNIGNERLEVFGDRIYFTHVPTKIRIRFNEAENDRIEIGNAIGITQDFYRVYLEWDATPDDNPIEFIAGWGFEAHELDRLRLSVTDIVYNATPLGALEDSRILGEQEVGRDGRLMLEWRSDIDGVLKVLTGFDGTLYYREQQVPVTAGVSGGAELALLNRWVRVIFEKAVPGTPQTELYCSVRTKKV